MKPKLLLLDPITNRANHELLDEYVDFVDTIQEADIIYTQLTPITTQKPVFSPCTGVDHIVSPTIIHLDSTWKQSEGRNITSTAEHTFSLILQAAKMNRMQLKDKVIGIIGYGRIGQQVAKYAKAFGMNILFYDIELINKSPGCDTFFQLLYYSNIISLHVPLNEQTDNLISVDQLKLMKPNAILVNTSRPQIVDEIAVLAKLSSFASRFIYANDFDQLSFLPNVISTPHIGGNCKEARELTDLYIINKIIEYIKE